MYLLGNGAFVVEGDLVGMDGEMSVDTLLGDIDLAVGVPLVEVEVFDLEDGLGEDCPLKVLSLVAPVVDGVGYGAGECGFVGAEVAPETR